MTGELLTTNAAPVFIELHTNNKRFFVNPAFIAGMNEDGDYTHIFTIDGPAGDGTRFMADETPEEILSLIEEAYR